MMSNRLLILLLSVLPLAGRAAASPPDSFTVYLFLLEDCKITQAYTDKLTALYADFAGDSIGFAGLFPNPISTDTSVQAFVEKYELPFPCTHAGAYALAKRLGVTVTPEVVLYNETRRAVLYQGRIDNLFERVGQRRRVVTSHELEAALNSVRKHQPVPIARTNAVGCFFQ